MDSMTLKKLTIMAALAFIGCALLFAGAAQAKAPSDTHAVVKETYTTSDIDAALKNGPVLLEFEQKSCGGCKLQHPVTEQVAGEYAGKATVMFVDVAINKDLVKAFKAYSYPQINVIVNKTNGHYTYVDKDGRLTDRVGQSKLAGNTDKGKLKAALDAAIRLRG